MYKISAEGQLIVDAILAKSFYQLNRIIGENVDFSISDNFTEILATHGGNLVPISNSEGVLAQSVDANTWRDWVEIVNHCNRYYDNGVEFAYFSLVELESDEVAEVVEYLSIPFMWEQEGNFYSEILPECRLFGGWKEFVRLFRINETGKIGKVQYSGADI